MPNKTLTIGSSGNPVDISVTGTLTASTPTNNSTNTQVATKGYVDSMISGVDSLPSQSGNSGKYLTTNGTIASWNSLDLSNYVPTSTTTSYNDGYIVSTIDNSGLSGYGNGEPCIDLRSYYTEPDTAGENDSEAVLQIKSSGITIGGNLSFEWGGLNASDLSSGTVNWSRLPTSRIYDATASRTANTFLAAPNGSAGAASFRTIASADLPNATTSVKGAVIAGSGLTMSSATLNHASSITAGTVGTSSATSGASLAVPYVTYNATGHITGVGTHTHTVNSLPASAISSGTLAIGRIPTSNSQSNSTSTVPTSALVYSMNQTLTNLSNAIATGSYTGSTTKTLSKTSSYTRSSGSDASYSDINLIRLDVIGTIFIQSVSVNNITASITNTSTNRAYWNNMNMGLYINSTCIYNLQFFNSITEYDNNGGKITKSGQSCNFNSSIQLTQGTYYLFVRLCPYVVNHTVSSTFSSSTVTFNTSYVIGNGGVTITVL